MPFKRRFKENMCFIATYLFVVFSFLFTILVCLKGLRFTPTFHTEGIPSPTTVPEVATTLEARQLSAMEPYDFGDGKPNGDWHVPKWRKIETPLDPELDLEKKFANGHI